MPFKESFRRELDEAERGISDQLAREWWKYFCGFPGFADIWSSRGYGTGTILPLAKKISAECDTPPWVKGENAALALPITARAWCIRTAHFDQTAITYGGLWAGETRFVIYDFTRQRGHPVPYKSLATLKREDNTIVLAANDGAMIRLDIDVPKPSETSGCLALLLDSVLAFDRSRVQVDQGPYWTNRWVGRAQTADKFVEGVFTFFSRVIDKRYTPD